MAAKQTLFFGSPAKLSLKNRQLCIEKTDQKFFVPLEDIGVVMIENHQISVSLPLLSAFAEENIVAIACDATHHPVGMLLPLHGHTQHASFLQQQISVSVPTQKRLWKEIVEAKICSQAKFLQEMGNEKEAKKCFDRLSDLKSGDPLNTEGQVARMYWKGLFGKDFLREQNGKDLTNVLLNYGYSLLRAAIARGVVAAGLNPALGIHHQNIFNPFALVDDLMEPFRVLVDKKVFTLDTQNSVGELINTHHKTELLNILGQELLWEKIPLPFYSLLERYCVSFREALLNSEKFTIPKL